MSGVCSYQVCRWNQTMGPIHMLGGRMGFQRDVSRLQEWTSRNLMKIKIKKCQVWDLGRASPWVDTGWDLMGWGRAALEQLCWEDLQVLVDGKVGVIQKCVLAAVNYKSILGCTKSSTARRSVGVIITSPQPLWDWCQGSVLDLLLNVRHWQTGVSSSLGHLSCAERLSKLETLEA